MKSRHDIIILALSTAQAVETPDVARSTYNLNTSDVTATVILTPLIYIQDYNSSNCDAVFLFENNVLLYSTLAEIQALYLKQAVPLGPRIPLFLLNRFDEI